MRTLSAIFMITFAAYLVVCLFTLLYGVETVVAALDSGDYSYTLYFVFVVFVPLATISGGALIGYYALLVATILISAIWLLLKSARRFAAELTMKGKSRDHSPFFDLCALMFAVLFVNTVIVVFLTVAGNAPTSPVERMEDWELLFILANASVWEELIARVMLIGLPLMVIDAFQREALRSPQRYILGGGIEIRRAQAMLVIISAVVFGLAHYEGWGSWKVFPAALAGMAFGYIFLKHGLTVAIMLHFSFDYLSMPLLLFEDATPFLLVVGLGVLLWIGLGMGFTIYFAIRIVEVITNKRYLDGSEPAPVGAAGPYSTPQWSESQLRQTQRQWHPSVGVGQGSFLCPTCGSGEAKWHDGGLLCLRCGRLFK